MPVEGWNFYAEQSGEQQKKCEAVPQHEKNEIIQQCKKYLCDLKNECETSPNIDISIKTNGEDLNQYILAPSENKQRFQELNSQQYAQEAEVSHMPEWNSASVEVYKDVLKTRKINNVNDFMNDYYFYGTQEIDMNNYSFDVSQISESGRDISYLDFKKVWFDDITDEHVNLFLKDRSYLYGGADSVEKLKSIIEQLDYELYLNNWGAYSVILWDYFVWMITQEEYQNYAWDENEAYNIVLWLIKEKIIKNVEYLSSGINNLSISRFLYNNDIDLDEDEFVEWLKQWKYQEYIPLLEKYVLNAFTFHSNFSDYYFEDFETISREYMVEKTVASALEKKENQKVIQQLGLSFHQAKDVYYNHFMNVSENTTYLDRQNYLESIKDKWSEDQKLLQIGINGSLLWKYYDFERRDNIDDSGVIDFDYITNEISKIYQIKELSQIYIEYSATNREVLLNIQSSSESRNEQRLQESWFFEKIGKILWISQELVQSEYSQFDSQDYDSNLEIIQGFNDYMIETYIDTNAVCKDVSVYSAWEAHVLGIKDTFAASNNWSWGTHVVDGWRLENGNLYIKNYWDIYKTSFWTLDKAMNEYEQAVLHWVTLANYYTLWADMWENIKAFQTKSGKILESRITQVDSQFEESISFLDESYKIQDTWFNADISSDLANYEYKFDSWFGVNMFSWMTDATLWSYKWVALRYDFVKDGTVFKSSLTHIDADLIGGGEQKWNFAHILAAKVLEHEFKNETTLRSYIKWEIIAWKSQNTYDGISDNRAYDVKIDTEAWFSVDTGNIEIGAFMWSHASWENVTGYSEFRDIKDNFKFSKPFVWTYAKVKSENASLTVGAKKDGFYDVNTYYADLSAKVTDNISVEATYEKHKWNWFSSADYRNYSVIADYSVNKNLSMWAWFSRNESIWNGETQFQANVNYKF